MILLNIDFLSNGETVQILFNISCVALETMSAWPLKRIFEECTQLFGEQAQIIIHLHPYIQTAKKCKKKEEIFQELQIDITFSL